ncbi:MAG: transcription termination factor Rho [Gemmatimonadetes bacterium]|nr:transcription termination factor Rho [Gemmatimonadota bacterium]MYA64376.1 transcription termination factor Rho [Gemmatimonadota bacterium]MYB97177.1 transcription termination factor Rho [Gemmatimonadota bacterium]MYH53195.1 transcription termination factor Rho [Gemmatimonadota bacterium]MYI45588.1 transcription termination factor Rho [Gemmatimonadota bacterium]
MEIAELKNRTVAELHSYAEALNIPHYAGLRKQDLIFTIYQGLLGRNETPRAEGVLHIVPEGFGFLRSPGWNYVAGPDDAFVSRRQIDSYGLRTGDVLAGPVRPPTSGERHLMLVSVDHVNGDRPEAARQRASFGALRPRYPDERLTLEVRGGDVTMRMMDLIAPVGMGQRGLIVSPPKAGKTTILRQMANAISTNHPEVDLFVLLIDERPEEVTEMIETTRGEVVSSTFDEPASRHRHVAEMVLAKAKRLVERGHDVAILLDSITRLARAYNTLAPHSGRILSGGVDANALARPKRFFGSARNVQWGGSLTIIATALIETGSRMDEVIFEEFKGTGNMELVLDREIADLRIFPAIDLNRSGTRREELLLTETELNRVYLLRSFLAQMPAPEAIEFLMERMSRDRTNKAFLKAMAEGV